DASVAKRRAALVSERDKLAARLRDIHKKIAEQTRAEIRTLDIALAKLRAEQESLPALATTPSPSNGYHSGILPRADNVRWVQVDLGSSVAIDEVRLIPARPTDFRDSPGFGFPLRFRVQISDDAQFSKAVTVATHSTDGYPFPG